eukprot:2402323-Lingulodinium_polyedra.AAC.1
MPQALKASKPHKRLSPARQARGEARRPSEGHAGQASAPAQEPQNSAPDARNTMHARANAR